MLLKLPYKAISTNELWLGRKTPSAKYKRFKRDILLYLEENYKRQSFKDGISVDLEVGFSNPLSDLDNSLKGLMDTLAEFFQFNDKQIIHYNASKYLVDKGSEYMLVTLKNSKKNIDRRTRKLNGKTKKS